VASTPSIQSLKGAPTKLKTKGQKRRSPGLTDVDQILAVHGLLLVVIRYEPVNVGVLSDEVENVRHSKAI
jgi:hypothetical protein